MTDKNTKQKTVAVESSVQDIAKIKMKTNKKWHKKLIVKTEKILSKITKLPIKISVEKDSFILNASAIFWYQDNTSKKFVMLQSNLDKDNDIVRQFPFVAAFSQDSVSLMLESAIKDLFGKAFVKTLAIDCFAADNVASVPTIILEDEENSNNKTVLHNMVWQAQITKDQFDLIENHSDKFKVVAIDETEIAEYQTHEIHKFIYQSCLRKIHSIKLEDFTNMGDSIDDYMKKQPQSKILH